jgi:hypothetical protein
LAQAAVSGNNSAAFGMQAFIGTSSYSAQQSQGAKGTSLQAQDITVQRAVGRVDKPRF